MSSVTLFDTEYITVYYLPEKKIVYHVKHQPANGQVLRDALLAGTEGLIQYGACKWLSDDRKDGPIPPEDVEWGDKVWNPRAIKAGWKYWALVVPPNVIAAGSLTPVIENLYELGLVVQVFSTTEDAIEWLDSNPNTK